MQQVGQYTVASRALYTFLHFKWVHSVKGMHTSKRVRRELQSMEEKKSIDGERENEKKENAIVIRMKHIRML